MQGDPAAPGGQIRTMFTGIVRSVGVVNDVRHLDADMTLFVDTGRLDPASLSAGDSLAVNGVCLTVVETLAETVRLDLSVETLSRTLFGAASPGLRVNLEPAVTPQTELGGHIVTGHVDGIGRLARREDVGRSVAMTFAVPEDLSRYIATKGSVCVDGVSLTVNGVDDATFEVNVVPYTLENTILGGYVEGDAVHLEVDLVARYVERLLEFPPAARGTG